MDVPKLCLLLITLGTAQAHIWLTINDEEVLTYVNVPSVSKPIKILCHQQAPEGYSIIPKRSILRAVTNLRSESDLQQLAKGSSVVWNQTYSLDSVEILYPDPLRAILNEIYNPSPDYLVSGYTLIAPQEEDSSVYKCTGYFKSLGGVLTAENTLWVVVSIVGTRDVIVTTMTINSDVASVYYRKNENRGLSVRCRTYIPGNAGRVLYHRVYKAQNVTTLDLNTMNLKYRFADYEQVYESNTTSYNIHFIYNYIAVQQRSPQDFMSGFYVPEPRQTMTGFYYCNALYEDARQTRRIINSSVIFLDERRPPRNFVFFKATNVSRSDIGEANFLGAKQKTTFTSNSYKASTYDYEFVTAVCYIQSWDYHAEAKLTVGDTDFTDLEVIPLDAPFYMTLLNGDVYHSGSFWVAISYRFRVTDICEWPFVSCRSWFPGHTDRQAEPYILEMKSSLCSNDKPLYLKSQGYTLSSSASLFCYPLATYLWSIYR